MNLPKEMAAIKAEIEGYAREYGLDFFPVIFELLEFEEVNEIAAKGGFPVRYPHWRFGMEYEHLSKGYAYGLQKIYEMVINTNPCYAYLLDSNALVDQKLVMAHVYAHCDFFKNNYWFSHTNRKMMDQMANHAIRIRKHIDRQGQREVEDFIDRCLSLENLIDYHAPHIQRKNGGNGTANNSVTGVKKLKSKGYLDKYINPPEFLEAQRQRKMEEALELQNFPEQPEKDIMQFLIEYAPIKPWQRDILEIIRVEAYYFAPQGQTKIMNEGWATYWHSKIMTTRVVDDDEIIDYADHHSGTVATSPGQLNPYKIGLELYRDIEDRWNRGRFGKAYDDCEDYYTKKNWDTGLGKGTEKLFEVRKIYNDVMFIDTFLTEEFCRENKIFTYRYNPVTKKHEINSREFAAIKTQLLTMLTNFGQPYIVVEDANHANRGELMLYHQSSGASLQQDYAEATLENIQHIWNRPVLLRSFFDGQEKVMQFDGKEHRFIK
jgi:stage V sporulation protein R